MTLVTCQPTAIDGPIEPSKPEGRELGMLRSTTIKQGASSWPALTWRWLRPMRT